MVLEKIEYYIKHYIFYVLCIMYMLCICYVIHEINNINIIILH